MTQIEKTKLFVTDLRRLLYLCKILTYNLDWMKASELCPTYLKSDINHIKNSINAMLSNLMVRVSPADWQSVKIELSKDELHDLSELLDTMYNVTNISEITEVIKECKTEVV